MAVALGPAGAHAPPSLIPPEQSVDLSGLSTSAFRPGEDTLQAQLRAAQSDTAHARNLVDKLQAQLGWAMRRLSEPDGPYATTGQVQAAVHQAKLDTSQPQPPWLYDVSTMTPLVLSYEQRIKVCSPENRSLQSVCLSCVIRVTVHPC